MHLNNPGLLREACLVDGQWLAPSGRETIAVRNPADQTFIAHVPSLEAGDVEQAVIAAERAFVDWSKMAARDRAARLKAWFDLVVAHADDLAAIMTAEQGKPLAEARGEVLYAASFIEWFAEEAKRVCGDIIPAPQTDKRILVLKQPVGVCAAITPWNFPAAMITRKAAPALAAGCTMIVKPAAQTPLTALAIGDLAMQAGIPAGVLQVVTGSAQAIGGVLTASDRVRKLSFTGSTATGRRLMAACASTVKRLSLELGGNAPFIVFDDADIDAAVEGAIASKYRNAGQTCVCANRIYVQSGVYDRFAARLAERVRALKVGEGTQDGVLIGPLIDNAAIEKVESLVADAVASGARCVTGGKRSDVGELFYEPTVLVDVAPSMQIASEEIFGPVAPLFRFDTESEVVGLANATEYGLASYFYTENVGRSWRVAEALEYGIVGHNTGLISNEVAPFGGVKQSGMGREGSKYGIEEYVEIKYVCSAVTDRPSA